MSSYIFDTIVAKWRLLCQKYMDKFQAGKYKKSYTNVLLYFRSVRVSVKSSALNCLSEVVKIYPQAMTLYLDKDEDEKNHNISGKLRECAKINLMFGSIKFSESIKMNCGNSVSLC